MSIDHSKYSEQRNKWSQKYHAGHIKQVKFGFSIEHDADILAFLDSLPNKQGYIKSLIRADIATRAKSAPEYTTATPRKVTPYMDNDPSRLVLTAQKDKEETNMSRIAICTINHSTLPGVRLTISYDPVQKAIYSNAPGEEDVAIAQNLATIEEAEDIAQKLYSTAAWNVEWIERDE